MRPDEEAVASEVERDQQFRRNVGKGIGTAATLAGGVTAARVLPFLNNLIPVDLAMKGLNKVAPKVADFLKRGKSVGLDIQEGMQYVKDTIGNKKSEEQQQMPKDNRNIIEKYSPELHQFLDQEIRKGRKPIEAAALAQHDKRFSNVIQKLIKDHKTPWSSIIDSIYGIGDKAQPSQQQPQTQEMQQPQQQQAKPGQGQQALMAILQKINQRLGQ